MRNTKDLYALDGRVAIVTGGRGLYGYRTLVSNRNRFQVT